MSTIVTDVFNAIKTQAQTSLGAEYKYLRKIFNPQDNDLRMSNKGFAIRHGAADEASGVTKNVTLDHTFQLVVLRGHAERFDDADIQTAINEIYNVMDEFLTDAINNKLGIPNTILTIDSPSYEEPVILENRSVSIVLNFNVKYRRNL